jgi:uncharacterized protein
LSVKNAFAGLGTGGAVKNATALAIACCAVSLLVIAPAAAQIQTPPGASGRPQAPASNRADELNLLRPSGQPPTPGFGSHNQTAPLSTYMPPEPGAIAWSVLAKVKSTPVRGKLVLEFDKEVMALNNREVKLQGFMMPLQPTERQQHFLLTVTPQTCAFCIPAGPEQMVEIRSKAAFKVTFEPIVLSGKLEVLKDDPTGVYYRIADAKPIREGLPKP